MLLEHFLRFIRNFLFSSKNQMIILYSFFHTTNVELYFQTYK